MEAPKFWSALALLGLVYLAVPVELSSKSNGSAIEGVYYPDMAFVAHVLVNAFHKGEMSCLGLVYDAHNIILEASCVANCKDDSLNRIKDPADIKVNLNITTAWDEDTIVQHKVHGVRVSEDFCKLKTGLAVLHTSRVDVEKFKPVRFYSGSNWRSYADQSRVTAVFLSDLLHYIEIMKYSVSKVEHEVCRKKWPSKPANFVCVSDHEMNGIDDQATVLLTADQHHDLIGFPVAYFIEKDGNYKVFEPISNYKSFIKANVWTGEDREDCDDEDR